MRAASMTILRQEQYRSPLRERFVRACEPGASNGNGYWSRCERGTCVSIFGFALPPPPKTLGFDRALPPRKNCDDFLEPQTRHWKLFACWKFLKPKHCASQHSAPTRH